MADLTPDAGDVEALAVLFDAVRTDHIIDVMQPGLLACVCGKRLPIVYGDDGQPLFNPAIRHHHERAAAAVLTSDWLAAERERVRRATGEQVAQAIERLGSPTFARIAREEASRG